MPGDTYTPPHRNERSTVFDDGDELMLRMGRENLRSVAEIEAERAAQDAYGTQSATERNRELSPVEYAGLLLEELHKARQDRMAA